MNQLYSYAYGSEGEGLNSIDLISNGQQFHWVYLEKLSSYNYVYKMKTIQLDGKEGKAVKLFENKVDKGADIPYPKTIISKDSSHTAFIAYFDANKKKRDTKVYVSVFTDIGHKLTDKIHVLRGNQKQYEFLDEVITSTGEVYLLAKYYKSDKAKDKVRSRTGKEVAGYELVLIKINKDGKAQNQMSLDLDGAFLHDAKLEVDLDDNLLVAGFLASQHKGSLAGLFVKKYDASSVLLYEASKKFSTKELLKLDKADLNVNFKSKEKKGLDRDFDMGDIIVSSDGGFIITAEENKLRRNTDLSGFNYGYVDPGFNNNRESMYMISNDVLSIAINAKGEISEEITLLQKRQTSPAVRGNNFSSFREEVLKSLELFMSFGYMNHEGEVYYMFNDDIDNIDFSVTGKLEKANRLDKMSPYIFHMNGDKQEREYLFEKDYPNFLVSPQTSKQISNNQYFFSMIEWRNKRERALRIGRLTFH